MAGRVADQNFNDGRSANGSDLNERLRIKWQQQASDGETQSWLLTHIGRSGGVKVSGSTEMSGCHTDDIGITGTIWKGGEAYIPTVRAGL
jgi:hypothetical protein